MFFIICHRKRGLGLRACDRRFFFFGEITSECNDTRAPHTAHPPRDTVQSRRHTDGGGGGGHIHTPHHHHHGHVHTHTNTKMTKNHMHQRELVFYTVPTDGPPRRPTPFPSTHTHPQPSHPTPEANHPTPPHPTPTATKINHQNPRRPRFHAMPSRSIYPGWPLVFLYLYLTSTSSSSSTRSRPISTS